MIVVIRQGVYMQGVVALVSTEAIGITVAKRAAAKETDDYHYFILLDVDIGVDGRQKVIGRVRRKGKIIRYIPGAEDKW